MGENTKIEWAHHTWNPWVGCTKVGPGCDGCYAEAWAKRAGAAAGVTWGGERRRTSVKNWQLPMRWNAQAEREGRRFRVFCASLADVFDNQVPPAWRVDLLRLIESTPNLDWLLLTKRIGNVECMLDQAAELMPEVLAWPMPNVWLGATVVNQAEADRDIPKLLAVQARVRFLSIEPMLGDIRLGSWLQRSPSAAFVAGKVTADMPAWTRIGSTAIDWVICGGEGGPGARPMHPDWARSLRDQCAAAGVPFLFKQWGEWAQASSEPIHPEATRLPGNLCHIQTPGQPARYSAVSYEGRTRYRIERVGKKAAGRLLDGRTHDEFPEVAHA